MWVLPDAQYWWRAHLAVREIRSLRCIGRLRAEAEGNARVPYFPTMCETSFSFSMQMYSISSVPVTNCQVNFTVQGLV